MTLRLVENTVFTAVPKYLNKIVSVAHVARRPHVLRQTHTYICGSDGALGFCDGTIEFQ